ncbi:MAG: phage holin family protein [Verrucomicrobiota bacterium]
MDDDFASFRQLGAASKQVARCLLTIGENRLELLMVEVKEERERLLRAFHLTLGVAAFGLLAGMTLTAAIVVWAWPHYSPVAVLLTLTGLYGAAGGCLFWRLTALLRDWQTLAASLDQLRKDRACLEKILE